MFIFDATPEAVKPAAPVLTEAQLIERDARDIADEPAAAEWDAMADAAAERDLIESGFMAW